MSQRKTITEKVASAFNNGVVVDRQKSTISNVLLCGLTSENERDYPQETLRRDKERYAGAAVFCNHGPHPTVERKIAQLLPEITSDSQGRPRGTLRVNPKHPLAESLFWAAEEEPTFYGMSHVAICQTTFVNGRERVEAIEKVQSVDLVVNPATTGGLQESRGTSMKTLKIKLLLERIAPKATVQKILKLKRLQEMEGMGELDVPMSGDDTEPDADEGITAAFIAACMSVINKALKEGSLDPKEALAQLKKLMTAHGDINGDGKVDDADVEAAGSETETETEESKKKNQTGKAVLEVIDLLDRLKLKAESVDVRLLALAAPADREALAKRLCFGTAERVKTTKRESVEQPKGKEEKAPPKLGQDWINKASN